MLKRRHLDGQDSASHGIDLAPMLDFVINLLIFFIIAAVFAKELGVSVNRPKASDETPEEPSVSLEIRANGDIVFEDRIVDLRAVRANVERSRAENPGRGIVIVAERQAATGTVVAVVDQIYLGGIDNVTFATTR